jgi:hypothetical protein
MCQRPLLLYQLSGGSNSYELLIGLFAYEHMPQIKCQVAGNPYNSFLAAAGIMDKTIIEFGCPFILVSPPPAGFNEQGTQRALPGFVHASFLSFYATLANPGCQAHIVSHPIGSGKSVRSKDFGNEFYSRYVPNAGMGFQNIKALLVPIGLSKLFEMCFCRADMVLDFVKLIEQRVQRKSYLPGQLQSAQLSHGCHAPVRQARGLLNSKLQKEAFDLLFYSSLFLDQSISNTADQPIQFFLLGRDGNGPEDILLSIFGQMLAVESIRFVSLICRLGGFAWSNNIYGESLLEQPPSKTKTTWSGLVDDPSDAIAHSLQQGGDGLDGWGDHKGCNQGAVDTDTRMDGPFMNVQPDKNMVILGCLQWFTIHLSFGMLLHGRFSFCFGFILILHQNKGKRPSY